MGTTSVYFFNSLAALKARNESQDTRTIFFYDGAPLEDAPSNCINVPIGAFYDYFLKTTYPQISQINFDNVDFSDEIKSQITQSITETITAIQDNNIKILNNLLLADINKKNTNVMIYTFLKYFTQNNDLNKNVLSKLLLVLNYIEESDILIDSVNLSLADNLLKDISPQNSIFDMHLYYFIKKILKIFPTTELTSEYFRILSENENPEDIINNFDLIKIVYPESRFKEYIKEFSEKLFTSDFFELNILEQKKRIFKIYYLSNMNYERGNSYKDIYFILHKIYMQAIKESQEELALFLYTPLAMSWSGVSQEQKEYKYFNEKVEKPLEKFILNTLMPKYKLKENKKTINKNKKIKVAFLQERIIDYSINKVFHSLIEALSSEKSAQYEFIIYDLNFPEFGGSDAKTVQELKNLGVRYVDLQQGYAGDMNVLYSIVQKSLYIRRKIIKDKIDILVGMHTRPEYNFLFSTRTAPKQLYWSHGNNEYDLEEIDAKISHANNNDTRFLYFNIPTNYEKYNPKVDMQKVSQIKETYPKNSFILGSIGRLIKLDNDEYLKTIAEIMKKNPNTIYLACGYGDQTNIKTRVSKLGIADRFHFTGSIDAHLYGHVIDMFLSPFPFGGGEALEEYRSKGKPYVAMHRSDIFKDEKQLDFNDIYNNPNQVFMIKSLYTKDDLETINKYNYLICENKHTRFYKHICVVTTQNDYIQVANRLIADENLREKMTQEYMFELQYNTSKTNGIYEVFKGLL